MKDIARLALLPLLSALVAVPPTALAESVRTVTDATLTLSLPPSLLADYGLAAAGARPTGEAATPRSERLVLAADAELDLSVPVRDGRLAAVSVPLRGGVALRAAHRGRALRPVFLYDCTVVLAPGGDEPLRLVTADPALPEPLRLRAAGVQLDPEPGVVAVARADVLISAAWAASLGRPGLAEKWIGEVELRLAGRTVGPTARAPGGPARRGAPGDVIDVLLGELYGISRTGRVGTYPDGKVGLAAATTSCNNGNVPVPWNAPMEEAHPFIGLALYRDMNGALEMIGQNWIKHGFAALQNDQCNLGCVFGSPFNELGVGCSDTYGVGANASPYYLGPRIEVNPHTGAWEACGSFFDAEPVDCERDYLGDEPDDVTHRIEVLDQDLDLPGAVYYYESAYFVADDDTLENNVGWRKCTMTWDPHGFWDFQTVGLELEPALGPVVAIWADELDSAYVAPDDGLAFLGVKVTPDGPDWHYEYALYNRTSARGIRSFAVPVVGATLSNVGFRDIDQDPGNDWTWSVADGWLTFSTDDWATDPDAPALRYQTLFNFRFDADVAPVAATARIELFEPGTGSTFFLSAPAPSAPVGAPELAAPGLALSVRPNPFRRTGSVSFAAARSGPARLSVLDVTGRTVRVLVDGELPAGSHRIDWDGRDGAGSRLAAGVYFFRLEQGDEARTRKGVLLR